MKSILVFIMQKFRLKQMPSTFYSGVIAGKEFCH